MMTAHDAVVTQGRLRPGESILVQGASSAVGLMALQIAKLRGAACVIGTSSNDERRHRLSDFGADLAVDTSAADWPERVLEATSGKGVDVVIDMVSGATVNASMRATGVSARMVNVGRLGGAAAEFDFDLHTMKRLTYVGVTFRTRGVDEVRQIVSNVRADLWETAIRGGLRLPIDGRFRLHEAPAAHARMRSNSHFGKLVLIP
jgi:NADPH2:quinone reductase